MSFFDAAILLFALQSAPAPTDQPNAQVIAQGLDRCMATYAVRLTRTNASDEAIYTEASTGCSPLSEQFKSAIKAQVPSEQAQNFLHQIDAAAKPNFMAMLARIRRDRAAQPAK